MNDYVETHITPTPCSADITDLMAALLSEIGYESFVPDDCGLTAYIKATDFDREATLNALNAMPIGIDRIDISTTTVEGQDWNAEWEKNYFQPIVIGNRCVIHSSFHHDVPRAQYDIVIDPKMAFGTGHHQTTTLILTRLLDMNLEGKTVTDVGTGTGILALLAAMRGATTVNAIEIDPFAHVNAVENVALNNHAEINVILGDASALEPLAQADVMLANINRNIITADMPSYSRALKPGGVLIVSGFYRADVPVVEHAATDCGLQLTDTTSIDDWCSIQFVKNDTTL